MEYNRQILFEIPYYIVVPDAQEDGKPQFEMNVNSRKIGLSFEKNLVGSPQEISGQALVNQDRFGNVVRSEVTASFPPAYQDVIPDDVSEPGLKWGKTLDDTTGQYIQGAVDALNNVIDIYREETGSYWIRRLTPHDIYHFTIVDLEDGEITNKRSRDINPGSITLGGFNAENIDRLKHRLESDSDTNRYQMMLLDIIEKQNQEEYDVVIMLSYVLFERWLKNAFIKTVSDKGKSTEEAENLIRANGKYVKLSNMIPNHIPQHTDVSFEGTSTYSDWDSKLRDERNKVVHSDYSPSESTAQESYEACVKTINWFQNELSPHLDGEPENVTFVDAS